MAIIKDVQGIGLGVDQTPLPNALVGKALSNFSSDKDIRIRRSGLIQAAVKAVASAGFCQTVEQLAPMARAVAIEMLKWVEGNDNV